MKELVLVDPEMAAKVWDQVGPLVKKAMDRGFPSYEVATQAIMQGVWLLWAVTDGEKIYGVAMTNIFDGDCFITGAAGNMRECLPFMGHFVDYARAQHCKKLRIIGRAGWVRMLPDFTPTAIVLEKVL